MITHYKNTNIELYKILIEKGYVLHNNSLSNAEFLHNMIRLDNGALFFLLNSLANINLISEIDVKKVLEQTLVEKSTTKIEEKTNECNTHILVKKYDTIEKLENDNNRDIYYDKELDTTDSIRCFFAILFLARDEKIDILQEEGEDEIRVTLIKQ